MRYVIPFLFLCGLVSAQKIESISIHSDILKQEREILIYTPERYDNDTIVKYEVVFVFDAHFRQYFDFCHSFLQFRNPLSIPFIVVGVPSPYRKALDYSRNNDLLPEPIHEETKKQTGKYAGNANQFRQFISSELIPYLNANYRTASNRIAVGHSNSAAFILSSLTLEPALFDAFIAVSPSLGYDKERLVDDLIQFDYASLQTRKFMFLSHANEEKVERWQHWLPARERAYAFLNNPSHLKGNVWVSIAAFPEESHETTFASGMIKGFETYFDYRKETGNLLSKETYEVTIRLNVKNPSDEVYITGNQASLANWNPDQIKMKRTAPLVRELTVLLQRPAEFKFCRGSWSTEAVVIGNAGTRNITPQISNRAVLTYELEEWVDRL